MCEPVSSWELELQCGLGRVQDFGGWHCRDIAIEPMIVGRVSRAYLSSH